MLRDLLIGIAASLIASVIVGFLGNKATAKQNSVILKIYVLFLSVSVFVVSAHISVLLNESFMDRLAALKGFDVRRFYSTGLSNLVFIFLMITMVTVGVILAEAFDRGSRRDHKENMDRWKLLR